MNDIEFIKKSVPFADGFTIEPIEGIYTMIELPHDERYVITSEKFSDFINEWDSLLFPLLLTRTIEGINRDHIGQLKITISDHDIIIGHHIISTIYKIIPIRNNIDSAKRSAIEYVLERL